MASPCWPTQSGRVGLDQRRSRQDRPRPSILAAPAGVACPQTVIIPPVIRILPAPGHTPGHIVVEISSSGETLLCISDLVLHPVHLQEPEWFARVDILPDQLIATRRALLERAAKEQCRDMAFHFPFPGLGRILPKGTGWEWEPDRSTTSG